MTRGTIIPNKTNKTTSVKKIVSHSLNLLLYLSPISSPSPLPLPSLFPLFPLLPLLPLLLLLSHLLPTTAKNNVPTPPKMQDHITMGSCLNPTRINDINDDMSKKFSQVPLPLSLSPSHFPSDSHDTAMGSMHDGTGV